MLFATGAVRVLHRYLLFMVRPLGLGALRKVSNSRKFQYFLRRLNRLVLRRQTAVAISGRFTSKFRTLRNSRSSEWKKKSDRNQYEPALGKFTGRWHHPHPAYTPGFPRTSSFPGFSWDSWERRRSWKIGLAQWAPALSRR